MREVKQLLPLKKQYFKANLHTHSTVSDGKLTPEEVKAGYKAAGYSIVAMTDHSITADHQHLNDDEFLFLNGVEVGVPDPAHKNKTTHLNLIFRDPHLLWVPVRVPDPLPHMQAYLDKCQCEELPLDYSIEGRNAIIAKAREKGALVIYNHPEWSLEFCDDYLPLQGLWGTEYRNSSCALMYGLDTANAQSFRELLQKNPDIVPIMADDMHGPHSLGNSWIMVGAEELSYDAVMDALEQRELYASCGPEICSITWDGANLTVTCSPAASVQCIAHHRRGSKIQFAEEGKLLTEAVFNLSEWAKRFSDDPDRMLRIIVTAPDGSYAVSRAYTAKDF